MNIETQKMRVLTQDTPARCKVCNELGQFVEWAAPGICRGCHDRYGPQLIEAHGTSGKEYLIRLTGGDTYHCGGLRLAGDWVQLEGIRRGRELGDDRYPFPMGLSIPLWQIQLFAPWPRGIPILRPESE